MPRRRQQEPSLFDVWIEVLKDMPAWVGPVVAASAFVFLRYIAPVLLPASKAGFTAGSIVNPLLPMLAWIVAGGLAVAWVLAETHKLSNRMRFDRQTGIGSVRNLSWQEFEHLVCEAYRLRGYAARVVGDPAGDGGVDVELVRAGEVVLVQCKHWQAWRVGVQVVRELLGVVVHRRATRGMIVTSGRFTKEALRFADGTSQIELVDESRLGVMVEEVRRGAALRSPTASTPSTPTGAASAHATTWPACPVCGTGMVMRTARKGRDAGSQFWGCPKYPACRGTRQVARGMGRTARPMQMP